MTGLALQIIPVPLPSSSGARVQALLEDSPKWIFLRARSGFDKTAAAATWLHAKPRRLKAALWIEALGAEGASQVALVALLAAKRNHSVIVLDATRMQHPLDAEVLKTLGAHARQVVVLARSTRTLPDHVSSVLEALVIQAEDLAYSPEDLLPFIPGIDAAAAQRIREITAGWPALVRLVAPHSPYTSLQLGRVSAGFAREKLATLSDRARLVALATCVVTQPTVDVTSELSGLSVHEAREAWDEIVLEGFASVVHTNEESTWQMVPLIREAQLSLLEVEDPERLRELDRRAARWWADRSQPVEAARHAIRAEDWSTAVEVIEDAAYSLYANHPVAARELLMSIPAEAMTMSPVARVLGDMLSTAGGSEAAFTAADDAHRHLRQVVDAKEVFEKLRDDDVDDGTIEIGLHEAVRRRHQGDFSGALEYHRSLHSGVEKRAGVLRSVTRTYLPIIYLQRGISAMLAGNFVDAEREFLNATRDGRLGFAALAQRNGFADIALLAAIAGDIPRAEENLNRMRARPLVTGFWARVVRFGELVAEALVATERLELEVARAALDKASVSADRDELWAFYLLARARFAVAEGSAAAALCEIDGLLKTHSHLAGPDSAAAFMLPWAKAELLLATDQVAAAGDVLREAPAHPLLVGVRALQRLQVGQPANAIAFAGADLWSGDAGPNARALGFLARAAAELALSLREDAATSFRFAHKLIKQFENRRLLGLLPRTVLHELATLLSVTVDLDDVPEMLPEPLLPLALTERELVVLRQLTTGGDIRSIASELFVSANTVRSQVRSLYRKLGVNSRDEAVAEASRRNLAIQRGFTQPIHKSESSSL